MPLKINTTILTNLKIMEADYAILFKIGNWFIAKQYDLNSTPKYKHIRYFLGKNNKDNSYSVIF